ncbi:MAG: deoxyguanosinetriphosphate triphosphohydrolase [bacterium]
MRPQKAKFFDRIAQEEYELQYLSPYGSKSRKSKGRKKKENPCPLRTEFQRDRDRIIHSKAFRRLKHKTQVFIAPFGDHYRTRLTHTLEVSQIARTISRALRLNEDLTEAIALGHDLGHTPFGHTGEDALNDVHSGGFRHAQQSLRVVERLEGEGGLNLTWEVRDGILNHCQEKEKILSPKSGTHPHTLEAEVVKIADPLAYVNHDIDDALRAGIIRENDLPPEAIRVLGNTNRKRIDTLVQDAVEQSRGSPHLKMSPRILSAFNCLRDFMYDEVYTSPILAQEVEKAYRVVSDLYQFYLDHINLFPPSLKTTIKREGRSKTAVDYVAGMTDQYALSLYRNYFLPQGWG